MSTLKLKGSTSGYVELTAPATAGNNTITLPTTAGTVAVKDASNNTEVGTGVTIGSPSSNVFTVSTNGSERFRVTSTGQLQATSASDVRLTLGSSGTAGTNDSNHIRGDGTSLKFMNASGGVTLFENNGTERFRITNDGVTFNGDTAAANALDDYEEGTWTPAWSFSTSGSASISIDTATYTKIGRLVVARFRASTSSTSSPTGSATITGLPFSGSGTESAVYIGAAVRFATDMPNLKGVISGGSTTISFLKNATNASSYTDLLGSDFNSTSAQNIISVTACYFV